MRNENSAAASVATTSVNTKKLALAAVFAAIAVVGSTFSVPVFGSKCAPVQHLVNVLCAVFLGPAYGVAAAFIASVIRNLMGLGSLLAFPGSMCGAFLSGYLYKKLRKLPAAYVGEIFGTGAKELKPVYFGPRNQAVRDAVENTLLAGQQGKLKPEDAWAKAVKDAQQAAT